MISGDKRGECWPCLLRPDPALKLCWRVAFDECLIVNCGLYLQLRRTLFGIPNKYIYNAMGIGGGNSHLVVLLKRINYESDVGYY